MTYIAIELFYFLVWPLIFFSRLRTRALASSEELLVLLFSLPLIIVVEAVNEFVYAGVGTYYPHSLLYFPGFKFPLAILLSSSLFPWLLYIAARWLATRIARQSQLLQEILFFGVFTLLVATYVVPEELGWRLGYWNWHVVFPTSMASWLAKYAFYFVFSFPPAAVARLVAWRVRLGQTEAATEGALSGAPQAR